MDEIKRDELLIRLDERTHEMQRDIKELRTKLYGNGRTGVCDVVSNHETTLRNMKTGLIIGLSIVTIICSIIAYIF